MPSDGEPATLLRAVLDEVRVNVPSSDAMTRRRIAAKLREALARQSPLAGGVEAGRSRCAGQRADHVAREPDKGRLNRLG